MDLDEVRGAFSPVREMLVELRKRVHHLGDQCPGPHYAKVLDGLNHVSDALQSWQRLEEM